jgi:NitT/TauT family transport system permease protein
MKRWLSLLVFFAALIIAWESLVRAGVWSRVLVPAPSAVAGYLVSSVLDGTLPGAIWITFRRLVLGFSGGFILGLPLGLLIAQFRFFENTLGLVALGLQALPSICWAPLALLWFGQTESAMFFIVIMGSVWSIALATSSGVRNTPPIYVRAARTMGSRGLHTWLQVILPAALPFIVSGMKQGWAFAWRSLMAAEIYITIVTGFGLGHLLHYGRELLAMDAVFGIMIVIILIGLVTDRLLFSPMEHFIHRRWGTAQ